MTELAERIKTVMKEKGFNQQKLADFLGISQPAVSLYLQGRMPPADLLYQIARLGGVSMEWLVAGGQSGQQNSFQVGEPGEFYGNEKLLLELWKKLPGTVRNDLLILIKHLLEATENAGGK